MVKLTDRTWYPFHRVFVLETYENQALGDVGGVAVAAMQTYRTELGTSLLDAFHEGQALLPRDVTLPPEEPVDSAQHAAWSKPQQPQLLAVPRLERKDKMALLQVAAEEPYLVSSATYSKGQK